MIDPLKLQTTLWPNVRFYEKQVEIVQSVLENDETYVIAGNMLGKDYVAGWLSLAFFISRGFTNLNSSEDVRVVTTSVKEEHLSVLWGEIGRHVSQCAVKLCHPKGITELHQEIRFASERGSDSKNVRSTLKGMVSGTGEGMSGRHAPHTLLVGDEASGLSDMVYDQGKRWANRMLFFGNPNPCENFFRRAIREGDVPRSNRPGYHRRIVRITAEDSPNVKLYLLEKKVGETPSYKVLVPGVLPADKYEVRRATWDAQSQCESLDAQFWEGPQSKMFPDSWLEHSAELARKLIGRKRRGVAAGIDTAEGGDDTSMAAVDNRGLIELLSYKTPDTNVIPRDTIEFCERTRVPPERWYFDRGNGKQHADRLRALGYPVETVGFGEVVEIEPDESRSLDDRMEQREHRYTFLNRRAQMYWLLRERIDPANGGWAIPAEYTELRRQLRAVPVLRDGQGRLYLPPKRRDPRRPKVQSLEDMIGRSPDDADAVVLANYGLWETENTPTAGALR